MSDTLSELFKVITSRRLGDPAQSYVASLHQAGLDKILEKVGEESIELILAAKNQRPDDADDRLISEMADLWFHTLVLLAHNDLTPEAVLAELQRRQGTSGIEEKKSRPLTSAEKPMPGPTELIIILIILLVVFGTKKLKNMGSDLGSAIKGFKNAVSDEDKSDPNETKTEASNAGDADEISSDVADKEKS